MDTNKDKFNLLDVDGTDVTDICTELHDRFKRGQLQTYLGNVLISVNPGEIIKDLKKEHHPSMHGIAMRAHAKMLENYKCCVVPTGVCGSGKSHCCEKIMEAMAKTNSVKDKVLMKKMIMLNKLLEAFTNAATDLHPSSTRCVKLFQLFFNDDGSCSGVNVKHYLLESLRLTNLETGEKSFHIFYYYFFGVDKQKLSNNSIKDPNSHRLSRGNIFQDFSASTKEESFSYQWKDVVQCLHSFGFNSNEIEDLVDVLTSVILLKDMNFSKNALYNVSVESEKTLKTVSRLLKLDEGELEKFLLTKEIIEKGEKIRNLRNLEEASQNCDSSVRFLYEQMLTFIIFRINNSLFPKSSRFEKLKINILDAFGFENTKSNQLEQLVINSLNEKLVRHCNQIMFKHFHNDIEVLPPNHNPMKESEFSTNDLLIDLLIEPGSFFNILDEITSSHKHSNLDLIQQLNKSLGNHDGFNKVESNTLQFVIKHTLCPVVYSIHGFTEKNRGRSFANDLMECFNKSESPFVINMLRCKPNHKQEDAPNLLAIRKSKKDANWSKKDLFLTQDFKQSLKELFEELEMPTIIIKCISPKPKNSSKPFDEQFVQEQIFFHNIPNTIVLHQKTFYISLDSLQFLNEYKLISFPMLSNTEMNFSNCMKLLVSGGLSDYFIGRTKIYLSYACSKRLNQIVELKTEQIKKCQAHIRRFLAEKHYKSSSIHIEPVGRHLLKPILKGLLRDCLDPFPTLCSTYWMKIIIMERESVTLKCYVRDDEVTINNSANKYDGKILGLKSPDINWLKTIVKDVIDNLHEGLLLRRDKNGNIFAKKLNSGLEMNYVPSYLEVSENENEGSFAKIAESKIFDMKACKAKILEKIRKLPLDFDELCSYCSVSINFHERADTPNTKTPNVRLIVINLSALELLGSTDVLEQLEFLRGGLKNEEFSALKQQFLHMKRA